MGAWPSPPAQTPSEGGQGEDHAENLVGAWPSPPAQTPSESGQGEDHAESLVGAWPAPQARVPSPDCQPVEETRTAASGAIAVTETQADCTRLWSWLIVAPAVDDGVVVQFHDVHLRKECTLEVFTFSGAGGAGGAAGVTDAGTSTTRVRRQVRQRRLTSRGDRDSIFSPMLLREPRVLIALNAPYAIRKGSLSAVNVTYEVRPTATLPQRVRGTYLRIYDCSSGNASVPSALRCDLVRQCADNEDEEGCDYTRRGCPGGWFPYRDQCLRLQFPTGSFSSVPGSLPYPTFPNVAEQTCRTRYGGRLARLVDSEGIQMVGTALRQSGYRSAVVGIKKVKPVNRKLQHFYR